MNPSIGLEPDNQSHLPNLNMATDGSLVFAFKQQGRQEAVFYEIMRRYKEKVYYHVRRIVVDHDDADDAAQTTFIRVWENLGSFRGDCALFSWIYRIATNEALTLLRKKRPGVDIDTVASELADLVDHGSYISGDELARKLQKILLTLPDKQRLVFQMKYYEDLTYEQMAEITGTSVGALKASYFHAVRKIEEQIQRSI